MGSLSCRVPVLLLMFFFMRGWGKCSTPMNKTSTVEARVQSTQHSSLRGGQQIVQKAPPRLLPSRNNTLISSADFVDSKLHKALEKLYFVVIPVCQGKADDTVVWS